ncbi:sensor histidine kinase [Clostridium brassicae]|uniref:histidine kinase n=1 Tax=Clostridium brassicae TaxID=2999072 RepID=A0ABT4D899_9CLOT|nr:HAMP domain-containing sensor histidine kinase [Clostridium brassicae]MCY6958525.1 HAMP domain-containing sensor histidine kinase [Clostridium brassicae]
MIKYIKREPLLKKIFLIVFGSLFFSSLIIFYFHFNVIQSIHDDHIKLYQEITGKMIKIAPEKENDIVKALLYERDEDCLNEGKAVLNKYSFRDEIRMWEDHTFKSQFSRFLSNEVISIIFILAIVIVALLISFNHFMNKLHKFSKALDLIIDGNFKLQLEETNEGIFSEIFSRLNQMSRILNLSLISLKKEKENIKSLVTDIAHQVKTPLSSIKLFNSLLMEEDLSKDEKDEFLSRSRNEINKLEWLFNSLVKISRMEVGMIELKTELNDLKDTLMEAVKDIYMRACEKGIEIVVKKVESSFVYHDSKWTKEAIFNVLENAVKYTDEKGKLVISMEKMQSYTRIDIQDTGIGIPREEFNNVFKRFYRGKLDKVKKLEGSGVGLYLTRKILEEQEGSIMVDSELEKGTKFSLYLQNCKYR